MGRPSYSPEGGRRIAAPLLLGPLQLDDAKFSTSRGHAIWGLALAAEVSADNIRFALAHARPEFAETSFSLRGFAELIDGQIDGTWRPWLDRLLGELLEFGGGTVPTPKAPTGSQRAFVASVEALSQQILAAYAPEGFSLRHVARGLCELVTIAEEFTAGQRRHRASPIDAVRREALAAEALAARRLAQLAAPIMPTFAQSLWESLGLSGEPQWDDARAVGHAGAPAAGVVLANVPDDLESHLAA